MNYRFENPLRLPRKTLFDPNELTKMSTIALRYFNGLLGNEVVGSLCLSRVCDNITKGYPVNTEDMIEYANQIKELDIKRDPRIGMIRIFLVEPTEEHLYKFIQVCMDHIPRRCKANNE